MLFVWQSSRKIPAIAFLMCNHRSLPSFSYRQSSLICLFFLFCKKFFATHSSVTSPKIGKSRKVLRFIARRRANSWVGECTQYTFLYGFRTFFSRAYLYRNFFCLVIYMVLHSIRCSLSFRFCPQSTYQNRFTFFIRFYSQKWVYHHILK